MKSKILQILRHSVVYGIGNVSQQLIGLILLPIYTTRLLPDEYGLMAILQTLIALLNILFSMRFSTTLFRFFFEDKNNKQQVVSTTLYLLMGMGALAIIIFWSAAGPISKMIFKSDQYALHLQIVSITLSLEILKLIPLTVLRAQKRALHYAVLVLSLFVFGLLLNIFAIVVLNKGVIGILVANAVTAFVFSMIGLYMCREFIGLNFSRSMLNSMVRYTLPLIPSALGAYVLQRSDRWFLQQYSTLAVIGIYSLGYKISDVVKMIVTQPFGLIWLPTAFEMRNKPDAKQFFEHVLTYVFMLSCWLCLGISLLSKELLLFMANPSYADAQYVVPWISLAGVFEAAYFVVNMGIFLVDQTHYSMWILGSAAVSNILFNFLLIPPFGAIGAALGTLLSYILLFVISWFVNQRFYPLQYEWKRILKIFAVFIVLWSLGQISIENLYLTLVFKMVMIAAYWGLLFLLGFFQTNELDFIKNGTKSLYCKIKFRFMGINS